MGDGKPDDVGDGAWLTYDQIAASRRITRRAAVRMTQRHRLRRQPGNDGLIRVWVPHDMVGPSQRVTPRRDTRDDGDDDARDGGLTEAVLAAMQSAHERETTALRERAEVAEAERDAAIADRSAAIALADQTVALLRDAAARADRSEAAIADERARADALRARMEARETDLALIRAALDQTQTETRKAHAAAETLRQADAARRSAGVLARLRAAWRGE